MRTGFLVLLVGLGLGSAGRGLAQTPQPAPPPTSPAAPQAPPATTPDPGPPQSMPAAVRQPDGSLPSRPAYGNLPVATPSFEVPTPAPAPVVVPPTTSAPASPPTDRAFVALPPYGSVALVKPAKDTGGSAYLPVDSWVYPAMTRLYSMGYLDTMFLSMRPYTRRSALHILKESESAILSGENTQAQDTLAALFTELADESPTETTRQASVYGLQTAYTRMMIIGGPVLRDSFHLGQTVVNDYGRPYQNGFNMIAGASSLNEYGPFSLYVRGEYQHSPSDVGYTQALAAQLSYNDQIYVFAPPNAPQATIPAGPVAAQNPFRLVEATLSAHLLGHEISGGKSDAWLGPGMGGAMAWSNNAENIYSFRIDRVEPLNIKYVSRLLGPVRYDFFYGSLKGHTYPNHPYVHSEMFSFRPTVNFEFGFQRTIIFGGAGHEPVTLHTFLKGFFDPSDTTQAEKFSRTDPGARFSAFNFSYRLPFLRDYLTLYTDSETHDDLTPVSAPRRAGYRPGLYLSHFPMAKRLDLRVEGVSTDCSTLACQGGNNEYRETIQRQGYTNKGFIFGDWIGREAKGGQAWMTWHLSGTEHIQVEYLYKKTPNDFIAGGTTQNHFKVDVVKRFGQNKDFEVNAWLQYEHWKAPIYRTGQQGDTVTAVQLTWFPRLHTIR